MNSSLRLHLIVYCIAFLANGLICGFVQADDARPNIIWIVVEDQSRHYGCYGEPLVDTPTIDRLASEGVRFTNAAVTGPICSICRSALITGMYQTSIGAHHHRSGRGEQKIFLPEHVKLIPHYFQQAGYYTSLGYLGHINDPAKARKKAGLGKSDYNFQWDESVYDGAEWSGRAPGQSFFAQIMLGGGKSRKQARSSDAIRRGRQFAGAGRHSRPRASRIATIVWSGSSPAGVRGFRSGPSG
jgi:arylsulfatase A-like enzyme